jgi:hypothetical protein
MGNHWNKMIYWPTPVVTGFVNIDKRSHLIIPLFIKP